MKGEVKSYISKILLGNKTLLIVLLLGIVLAFLNPRFLTSRNMFNVLRQVCVVTIVAVPYTFIIASGGIDLSVGSTIGLVGIFMGTLLVEYNMPITIVIFLGLLLGLICGSVNAFIISIIDLPPFIVTFATQSLFRGIVYISTNMVPVNGIPEKFIYIGQGYWGPVPIPVCLMAIVTVLFWVMAKKTAFGRHVIAMGGNANAAYICGINIKTIRLTVFCLVGLGAALSAVVLTGRTASAQVSAGIGLEMDCITAVVVGGTAFSGGILNVLGTLFGSLIVGIINNGLNLLGVDSNFQIIAKGLMIMFALIMDKVSTILYMNILNGKYKRKY